MGLREKLLEVGVKSEVVEVSGLKIECLEMTVEQRISTLNLAADQKQLYPALIIVGTRDPKTKEPIFKEGDEAEILAMGFDNVELMAGKISELSGITAAAKKATEKNS